ncbi:glutamate receptor 1-like [Musca domestica]|uniref:Glutamate receptor 1-like n=1 Tax=Musca domestica TaxID=7370 RepID=A0A9J7IF67_MUSDO|nr:glutamate receptor 1-like [Musca domestica]XP_058988259.1 glutamate receptor 1-like [Musca domestica]
MKLLTFAKVFNILCYNVAIIVALGQLACCGKSCELLAFKEYLDFQHLKQAIVIYGGDEAKAYAAEMGRMNNSFLKFFNTNQLKENTDFYQLLRGNSYTVGILMSHASRNAVQDQLLVKASELFSFNNSISWFVILENNCNIEGEIFKNIRETFGHFNILFSADFTVVIKKKKCYFDLYDIYKICYKCNDDRLSIEYKGNWSRENGLSVAERFRLPFVLKRNNFRNSTVNVAAAILNYSPSLNMTMSEYLNDNKRYLQNDFMQRKTYQLMTITQDVFNYSFNLKIEDSWGVYNNGTWTGVIGLINSNDAEFSLSPLRYMTERLHVVSYTPVVHVELVRFLLRHPKRTSIRNIFFEPLAVNVWWCVLALIITTGFLLGIHVYTEYHLYWKMKMLQPNETAATFYQLGPEHKVDFVVLTILETAFMQGPSPEQFHANSTRLLLTSVSVFAILLMQFYGGYIVGSLLSETPRTITNLDALYSSSMEIGMEDISYNYDIFNLTSNRVAQKMYKNRICKNGKRNIVTLEEGLQRIAKGSFALHVSLNRAYQLLTDMLTESQFCELQEITFNNPFVTAIGAAKTTPYLKYIKSAVLKFREAGIMKYNDLVWKLPKIDCAALAKDDVEVDLEHFAPVLVFLAFSIMISVWILMLEFLYKRIEKMLHINYENMCRTIRKCLKN